MPDTIVSDAVSATIALDRDPASRRLLVSQAPDLARLSLRGAPSTLGAAFGITLPVQPCRASAAGDRTALWLGPDEWLLLAPPGTLDGSRAVEGGAATDISHRQIGLVLDDQGAEEALAIGGPRDLHRSAFPTGMCTRTVFGKAEIVLWRQDTGRFHVEVWRSFAAYVQGLLDGYVSTRAESSGRRELT